LQCLILSMQNLIPI